MMLANTLVKIDSECKKNINMNIDDILELFLDNPKKCFSIHQITAKGEISMDK